MTSKYKTVVDLEDRNGRVVSRRKEYHANGNLYREGVFSRGQKSWEWNCPMGIVRTYHENGQLKCEEHYDEHGVREGETIIYDPKGTILKKITYIHDKIVREESFEVKEDQKLRPKK